MKLNQCIQPEFVARGKVHLELGPDVCEFLVDEKILGVEELLNPIDMVVFL